MKLFLALTVIFSLFLQEDKEIKVYTDFEDIKPLLNISNDTTYIVNFWATWCVPCRKELPDFEKFGKNKKTQPIKIILVSLDNSNDLDNVIKPFITKHKIVSEVVVFDDPNSNYWINQIDKSWSGTIPATLIYNKNFRSFFPYLLSYEKLDSIVKLIPINK